MKKLIVILSVVLFAASLYGFSDDLYRDLTRRPERVEKEEFDFDGEVLQWMEGDTYSLYRVATEPENYGDGFVGNVIFFVVPHHIDFEKFMDGDIVDIMGAHYEGNTTYESIFGQEITVPLFTATYSTVGSFE